MSDTNFASLSPSLLARKGGAKPAMRPQVSIMPKDGAAAHGLEDLGWNDMGEEDEPHKDCAVLNLTPEPANAEAQAEAKQNDKIAEANLADQTARKPIIVKQQEAIAEKLTATPVKQPVAEHTPVRAKRPRRSALARGKRAAFTLRLDAERHLKLRLASTMRNRSAQQLVTDALDQLLGEMSDVNALAAQAQSTE